MDLTHNPKEAIIRVIETKKAPHLSKIQDLLAQIDKIQAQIEAQKEELKFELSQTFDELEHQIKALSPQKQKEALEVLQECKLNSLELLGILSETTEVALINALEKNENLKETVEEITKDLTFQAIDININPKEIKNVTKTILNVAVTLAESSINYSDELIDGAIIGTKKGINKSIQKFKQTIEYTPEEAKGMIIVNYKTIIENLNSVGSIYKEALLEVASSAEPGIKEKILSLSQKNENILEKIKQEAQTIVSNLKQSFEDLLKEKKSLPINPAEAKELGLKAFSIAKEKIEEALKGAKDAINK